MSSTPITTATTASTTMPSSRDEALAALITELFNRRDKALAALRELFNHADWTTNEDNTAIMRALQILKAFPALAMYDVCSLPQSPQLQRLRFFLLERPIYHFLTSPAVNVDILCDLVALQKGDTDEEEGEEEEDFWNKPDMLAPNLELDGVSVVQFACAYLPLSENTKEIIVFLAKQGPRHINDGGYRGVPPTRFFMHQHCIDRFHRQRAQHLSESELSIIYGVLDTLIEAGGGNSALSLALDMAIDARCLPLVNLLAPKVPHTYQFRMNGYDDDDPNYNRFGMAEAKAIAMIIHRSKRLENFSFYLYEPADTAAIEHVMTCLANGPPNLTEVGLSIPQNHNDEDCRLQLVESFIRNNQYLQMLHIEGDDTEGDDDSTSDGGNDHTSDGGGNDKVDKFCISAVISGLKHRPSENAIQDLTVEDMELASTDLYELLEVAPASLTLDDNKYSDDDTDNTTSKFPRSLSESALLAPQWPQLTNLTIKCEYEPNYLMLFFESIIPRATNLKNLSIVKLIPEDDDDDEDDEDQVEAKPNELSPHVSRVGSMAITSLLRHGKQLEVVSLEGIAVDAIPIMEQLKKGNNTTLVSLTMNGGSISTNQLVEAKKCLLDVLKSGSNYSLTNACLGRDPEEDSTDGDDCDDGDDPTFEQLIQKQIDYYLLLNRVGRKELHQQGANAKILVQLLHNVVMKVDDLSPISKASLCYNLLLEQPSLWATPVQEVVGSTLSPPKLAGKKRNWRRYTWSNNHYHHHHQS